MKNELTKREQIAVKAMAAIIASTNFRYSEVAESAVCYADALIKELRTPRKGSNK